MRCFGLIAFCCLMSVVGTGFSSNVDSQVVSVSEADQLMGQCGDYGPLATWVCYGGNCMSGGCGCARVQEIIAGDYKIADATPCASSFVCTAPQDISTDLCGY